VRFSVWFSGNRIRGSCAAMISRTAATPPIANDAWYRGRPLDTIATNASSSPAAAATIHPVTRLIWLRPKNAATSPASVAAVSATSVICRVGSDPARPEPLARTQVISTNRRANRSGDAGSVSGGNSVSASTSPLMVATASAVSGSAGQCARSR
jgi:hypothetical protein